jgi:hypothetical protein
MREAWSSCADYTPVRRLTLLSQLAADEAREGAVISRDGEPDRHVVWRLESDDSERFEILVVERV